jgi:hypothetical protein
MGVECLLMVVVYGKLFVVGWKDRLKQFVILVGRMVSWSLNVSMIGEVLLMTVSCEQQYGNLEYLMTLTPSEEGTFGSGWLD